MAGVLKFKGRTGTRKNWDHVLFALLHATSSYHISSYCFRVAGENIPNLSLKCIIKIYSVFVNNIDKK